MFNSKLFVVILFFAIAHAVATGQFSRPLQFYINTG
jgi:hypothetical protein